MNRFASLLFAALISLAAAPALADLTPDPCMMAGAKVGNPCMDFTGADGTCQPDPNSTGVLMCTRSSSTSSGSTGAGAGGSSSSSSSGGGGCSMGGFDPAGIATLSAGLAVLAGAALRRRRARKG